MYLLQRGDDAGRGIGNTPKKLTALPLDVVSLNKGEWRYSDELRGFVGYLLTGDENTWLYLNRIGVVQ